MIVSAVAVKPVGCSLQKCENSLRNQSEGFQKRVPMQLTRHHWKSPHQCLAKVVSSSLQEKDGTEASGFEERTGVGRRAALLLGGFAAGSGFGGQVSQQSLAGEEGEVKRKNVPIEEIKGIIAGDIAERQYFITGKLTTAIFSENCRFKDPTNDTTGLRKYLDVVNILFDPATSSHELISIEVNSPNTILAKWRLGGYLQFPWRPRVVPFEGSTLYTVGDEGLIVSHEEKWGISPITALIEAVTPSWIPSLL
eukprot:TRINITY_DN15961_c0_g1_i1.p1 TRINITY_DN15961_c0_g1~~TRINITY_DN15961_c0_g1_i1.p1  ORF type:complete len:252 (+),score=43.32 TRINITY_DN15961_c0_g1_i1:27-782(+)